MAQAPEEGVHGLVEPCHRRTDHAGIKCAVAKRVIAADGGERLVLVEGGQGAARGAVAADALFESCDVEIAQGTEHGIDARVARRRTISPLLYRFMNYVIISDTSSIMSTGNRHFPTQFLKQTRPLPFRVLSNGRQRRAAFLGSGYWCGHLTAWSVRPSGGSGVRDLQGQV